MMIFSRLGRDSLRWIDDLRNLKRPRVLRASQTWSSGRLAYNSMMIGAFCSIWTLLVILALEQWRPIRVSFPVELGAALTMLLAMAFGLLVFFRFQIREARRAVTA